MLSMNNAFDLQIRLCLEGLNNRYAISGSEATFYLEG